MPTFPERRPLPRWTRYPVGMRVALAWNILRGRPTAYRVTIRDGGFSIEGDGTMLVENTVHGANVGFQVHA